MIQGNEEWKQFFKGSADWQREILEGGLRRKWTAVESCKENKEL